MKKTLFTILSATALGLFGPTASAQLSITASGAEKLIDFETSITDVVKITTGGISGLMEKTSWQATGGGNTGLLADGFSTYRTGLNVGGGGNGVAGRFIDADNNGNTNGVFSGNDRAPSINRNIGVAGNEMLWVSEQGAWAGHGFYLRIKNNTGAPVSDWSIAYDMWVKDNDANANNRSTITVGYAVDDGLDPNVMTLTELGSDVMPNTANVLTQYTGARITKTFTTAAPVANGGFLVFYVKKVATNPGSGVYLDNIGVTGTLPGVVDAPVISPVGGTYSIAPTLTLTSSTAGATIYYTLDGSAPTTSSFTYTGPFPVTTSQTVTAFAVKSGSTNSTATDEVYVLEAGAPSFSLISGTYVAAPTVTLSSVTPGASIYYTLDGSPPDDTSTLYTGPVAVNSAATLSAVTYATNYNPSSVVSRTYGIDSTILASWSFGANPLDSAPYTLAAGLDSGIVLTRNAFASGYSGSGSHFDAANIPLAVDLAEAITGGSYATFTLTPEAGKKVSVSEVNFRVTNLQAPSTPVGEMLFSLDGFATYTSVGAVTVANGYNGTLGTFDVSAVAALQNQVAPVEFRFYFHGNIAGNNTGLGSNPASDSDILLRGTVTNDDATAVSDPTFTPVAGAYVGTQNVSISTATAGATIHYTTDGSTPTTGSPVYSVPLVISASSTVKALAVKSGSTDSAVVSAAYTITHNYTSWAASQVPPVTGGTTGDSDNDGIKNLVEYALADGTSGTFTGSTLSFTKRGGIYGSDVTYSIEESTDLSIWTPAASTQDTSTISYVLTGGTKKFARLKVTQP